MPSDDLRNDHIELLFEYIRRTSYPSGELLNRIEDSLRTEAQARAYIEVLREKVRVAEIAPSLHLIDRLDRVIRRVEIGDAMAEALSS